MFEGVWLQSDYYCSSCSSLLPGNLTARRTFWSWRREKLSISLCPGAGSLSWGHLMFAWHCSVRAVVYSSLKKCIRIFFVLSDTQFFILAADEVAWRLRFTSTLPFCQGPVVPQRVKTGKYHSVSLRLSGFPKINSCCVLCWYVPPEQCCTIGLPTEVIT